MTNHSFSFRIEQNNTDTNNRRSACQSVRHSMDELHTGAEKAPFHFLSCVTQTFHCFVNMNKPSHLYQGRHAVCKPQRVKIQMCSVCGESQKQPHKKLVFFLSYFKHTFLCVLEKSCTFFVMGLLVLAPFKKDNVSMSIFCRSILVRDPV